VKTVFQSKRIAAESCIPRNDCKYACDGQRQHRASHPEPLGKTFSMNGNIFYIDRKDNLLADIIPQGIRLSQSFS